MGSSEAAVGSRATDDRVRKALLRGVVIPAHPLALTAERKLDERHQRALTRYYCDAGAGGIAVGVHTTQFAIRDPKVGLFEPVLMMAAEEIAAYEERTAARLIRIAGLCGPTRQACAEAELARELGYDLGLLSLAALRDATLAEQLAHVRQVGAILPLVGFYLQPAVGGALLPYRFWREFCEIETVVAIKVAPFNRYQTLDVIRAVAESGRSSEIALYTGNDDNIVADLITEFPTSAGSLRFRGGLLGQWAVGTRAATDLLGRIHEASAAEYPSLLQEGAALTDLNAALFDVANGFAGCIAGIHAVLVEQGLMAGRWCLERDEDVSPGQMDEIERVTRAYPQFSDDDFIRSHLDRWLAD